MHLKLNKRLNSFLRDYSTPAVETDHNPLTEQFIDESDQQNKDTDVEMANTGTHDSAACCSIPAPKSYPTYEPKGTYTTISNTKTYVVGPADATKAVFFLYDVFGYKTPTLQGADILANEGSYLVFMPDFFDDGAAEVEWLAQDTDEKKAAFGAFMKKIQDMPRYLGRIQDTLSGIKETYPNIESFGSIGYCWGGKMVAVTSSMGLWKAGIQSSPAMVDPEDAKKVTIPMCVLASKDEPKDKIQAFDEGLKTAPKHVETFESSIHGWMSARADLESEGSKKEYERGYQVALEFYKKHL